MCVGVGVGGGGGRGGQMHKNGSMGQHSEHLSNTHSSAKQVPW